MRAAGTIEGSQERHRDDARFASRRCRDWRAAPRRLDVVFGEFWWTFSRAARAPMRRRDLLGCAPGSGCAGIPLMHQTCEKPAAPAWSSYRGLRSGCESDTAHPQVFDGFDQLLHRPRQAVALPNVAAARVFEGIVQSRAIRNRARHLRENLLAPPLRSADRAATQGSGRRSKPEHNLCNSTTWLKMENQWRIVNNHISEVNDGDRS